MASDIIEKFKGCLIQHGDLNKRIYIMKWQANPNEDLLEELDTLAKEKGYTKIFGKIPQEDKEYFLEKGYLQEARIPDYFGKDNDCLFLSKFFSEDRAKNKEKEKIDSVIALSEEKANLSAGPINKAEPLPKKATPDQAKELAALYEKVFASYPFPIYDSDYIKETMKTHIDYYYISSNQKIVAASSAEKDLEAKTVEMTDFATLPEFRGKGLATILLNYMGKPVKQEGFRIAYTIARAYSAGMNITFAKSGYTYAGTLVNNTYIAGNTESMNVWYKFIIG